MCLEAQNLQSCYRITASFLAGCHVTCDNPARRLNDRANYAALVDPVHLRGPVECFSSLHSNQVSDKRDGQAVPFQTTSLNLRLLPA